MLGFALCLPIPAPAELQFSKIQGELVGVPPPEIPVRAANVVSQADTNDKESATTNVLLAVVEMNPCTVPSTVAQIARTSPTMASLAAATAVSLQPNQVFLITKASVGAVPTQIGVAESASQVYPSAGTNILNGVIQSIPVLRPYIDTLVAKNPPGADLPVAAILNQSTMMALHHLSAPKSPATSSSEQMHSGQDESANPAASSGPTH